MRSASTTVDTFLDSTKELLMMPCAALFQVFPKLVRDVARDLGKDVEFSMSGVEVELDRRILAQLRDPLVHLLRNAIDHGVGTPEERALAGKGPKATLTLSVNQADAGMVEIIVADDGKGIDPASVKASALKQGVITEAEAASMSNDEAINLIFQSALSTAKIITEISGRGLGLAIVKENIGNLGGKLVVETQEGPWHDLSNALAGNGGNLHWRTSGSAEDHCHHSESPVVPCSPGERKRDQNGRRARCLQPQRHSDPVGAISRLVGHSGDRR